MGEFLARLFDTSDFPARWNCGNWSYGHGLLHILSDLGVWSAYVAIPCVLMYFASRKRDLPFRTVFWLFGAFILACGTTHLIEAIIFRWPIYRFAGVVKLLTALVSWGTVLALVRVTPQALALRTPQELSHEINVRQRAENELLRVHAELEERVAARTAELTQANAALQAEIAARERFEEALFAAREWFEVTLASIGDAVIVTDTEGRITFLNQIARNLTARQDDVRGQPLARVFDIVHERTGQPLESPVLKVLSSGQIGDLTSHAVLLAADGTRRPVDDSVAPIRSPQGDILGAVLVFRDVTERRRAEAALRQSEERYRALVQATSQIVWTTDPQGKVVDDSPSWRAFTGQSYEEWKGSGWLDALHPDDREATLAAWNTSIASRTPYEVEYRLRSAQGEYCYTVARSVPVVDDAGRVVEWVGMNVDVTKQREAAEALRQAGRRKDHFLAMLGHELRNPLSGISGAIQVLSLLDPSAPEAGEMRQIIDRQTRHMNRLIDDLLEVSRITRGKIQIRREALDLTELVRHTAEDLRPILGEARLQFDLEVPDHRVTLAGDPTRLSQILVNLIQNAVKFTNPGGRVAVSLKHDEANRRAIVSVSDTGIGLSPEILAYVFEPFSQADSTLDRSRGGLGLGLALVKGLVELHGGTVAAASSGPGSGARFTVTLPTDDSAEVALAPAEPATPAVGALRILIIDDQKDASLPMQKLLELDGHEVQVAADGKSGIAAAKDFRPQVVLCDIGLPDGLDGYAVARALRSDSRTSEAQLVAVTGYGQEEDRRQAAAAGFNRHLTKPVLRAQLQELLLELAESRSQAKETAQAPLV